MENTINARIGFERKVLDRTDYYAKQWRNSEGYKDTTAFRAEAKLEMWCKKMRAENGFVDWAD